MKLLFVMLLITSVVSSMQAASDTLRIKSQRIVNACTGEQRWLITASIGEVFASDSLQSFDIIIGYDTSIVTPTDGLSIGTLSAQMNALGGPFFNFQFPGEIQAGGFTLNGNVKGNLPVFAISGVFKKECKQTDTLFIPWVPEFNEEFKGTITVFDTDSIQKVVRPLESMAHGVSIDSSIVSIDTTEISDSVHLTFLHEGFFGDTLTAQLKINDTGVVTIDSMKIGNANAPLTFSDDSTKITTSFAAGGQETTTATLFITKRFTGAEIRTTMSAQVIDTNSCNCIVPALTDSVEIVVKNIVTTLIDDVHDSTVRISRVNETLILQFNHGQQRKVTLVDVLGNIVFEDVYTTSTAVLNVGSLSSGIYHVVVQEGTKTEIKKIVK